MPLAAGPSHSLADLAQLIADGNVFVLTGAGVSTDSGIPDYRGADGVSRATPMLHQEFVRSADARRRYWARSYAGWDTFRAAAPNDVHRDVAWLQTEGYVTTLVTQNVDGLHQRGGSPHVVELHGALRDAVCLTCQHRHDRDALQQRMADENPDALRHGTAASGAETRPDGDVALACDADFRMPTCRRCGGDCVKPDVVFFGASVPRDRVEVCFAAVERARAVLVLGSSLAVMSGYRFVRRAAQRGIPVAIVTRGWCRGGAEATIRIDGDLASTLAAVRAARGG